MKIAVVTGASSGLGREFALQLARTEKQLEEIWVIARRQDRLEVLRPLCPVPLRVLPLDLTAPGAADALEAALAAAMQAVSQEVAPAGLRVHCLAPGLVRTPMLDTSVQNLGESYLSAQEAAYPLGLGRPEDVAFMAAFLLSDKAAWISGQNFVLAGGRY